VLAYLSRYTHRVAIGNKRLLKLDPRNQTVTFAYKDYADHARPKTMTLSVVEFARRFCLHILPNRFVKIRHFGFLSNRDRTASIEAARALLNDTGLQKEQDLRQQSADLSAGVPPFTCPHCGSLRLRLIQICPPIPANSS
jgi:Putative transposase